MLNKKWIFRIVLIVCLVLIFVGLVGPAAPVLGAQYNDIPVTTTDDELNSDGDCSLREAIQTANTDSDVDACKTGLGINRVQLPAGIYTLDLVGAGEDLNATGDLDILDGGDLVIQGDGAGVTIIDGNDSDRVFHVCPGGSCTNTVTFNGVTVRNGNVDGHGGGIFNNGGVTTVDASTVISNTASDDGGGVYNAAGTTTVDASVVISNTATCGGGIYNAATLNVQNGSTIGEIGAANTASDGGGIYNAAGTTTVYASAVISNTASVGGGIHNAAGTTTVDGSTVSANMARGGGGGIYNDAALNVQNGSTIGGAGAGNQATLGLSYGGGIYNGPLSTMVLDSSTVSANTAKYGGGGIYNITCAVTVTNSIVSANAAKWGGGVSGEWATVTVNNSTVGGEGAGNMADYGSGIHNRSGTTTVESSTVSANTANNIGGGIYNIDGTVTVNGSTVSANIGMGIYNSDGTVTVNGSTISANTSYGAGGGIYNWKGGLTVTNSIIGGEGAGNLAYGDGGGISNKEGTTTIDATTVSHNTADSGGGILNRSGTMTIDATTVSHNTADWGGGIYVLYGTLNVQNGSTIGSNTANVYGGGVYNYGGTATVTGSRILYNTAVTGGGVDNRQDAVEATSVTGSCILGNSDTSFYNSESEEQIATGNWWGAASGPSGTGPGTGDSVGANVDYSGFLTAPILGCAPDLQVSKANDTGGEGRVGVPFTWTLTISNTNFTSATFAAGATILMDDLPAGPVYGAPAAGSFVNVVNSANIQCGIAGNALTCDAAGGSVTIGRPAGSFKVTFSVTPTASGTLNNPRSDGDCKVDPGGHVGESDDDNNGCPANSVNVTAPSIAVSTQASVNSARVGQTITYTYRVTNTGDTVLESVAANDDLLGAVPLGTALLAPGEGASGKLTHTVDAGDLPGPLTNTVVVTGSPLVGPVVTANASASVSLTSEYRVYLPLVLRDS